jgi:hypothetical protein
MSWGEMGRWMVAAQGVNGHTASSHLVSWESNGLNLLPDSICDPREVEMRVRKAGNTRRVRLEGADTPMPHAVPCLPHHAAHRPVHSPLPCAHPAHVGEQQVLEAQDGLGPVARLLVRLERGLELGQRRVPVAVAQRQLPAAPAWGWRGSGNVRDSGLCVLGMGATIPRNGREEGATTAASSSDGGGARTRE